MTTQQAKQVLLAYRPWAVDTTDAEMVEALALCRKDATLARWFAEHCQTQEILRAKFQGIKAPEGLTQQIVSEARGRLAAPAGPRRNLIAVLACIVIIASGFWLWRFSGGGGAQDLSFNAYRQRMIKTASRAYGMDVETNNLAAIKLHLATQQAPVDFETTDGLAQTALAGCGVLRWQNRPVSMVCYQTGKALTPGLKSDLILFVVNQTDVSAAAWAGTEYLKVSEWFTASWQSGDKLYLLAALDEAELRKRF